ncbi:MAG: hypothetical protein EA409_12915 [Saprospirales bacterium]|nr:MAG: hypothetical protein EA409_12915 [Saprospirales bacterium]
MRASKFLLLRMYILVLWAMSQGASAQDPAMITGDRDLRLIAASYDPRPGENGAIYLLGRTAGTPFLSRINPDSLDVVWTTSLPGLPGSARVHSFTTGIDNTDLFIATNIENQRNLNIIRLTADGTLTASHRIELPYNFRNTRISASEDRYIVHTSRRLGAIAFDADFNTEWVRQYNSVPGYDQLHESISNGKGGIFMFRNNGSGNSPVLMEVGENGDVIHQRTLNFNNHLYSQIQYVTYDGAGNLVVLGFRNNHGANNTGTSSQANYTGILISYDPSTLSINWQREIALGNGPFNANGWRGQVKLHQNQLFVTLGSNPNVGNESETSLLLQLDPITGNILNAHQSVYPTNANLRIINAEGELLLLDNNFDPKSGIFIQPLSSIEQSCLFEPAEIELIPGSYLSFINPLITSGSGSINENSMAVEGNNLSFESHMPCCETEFNEEEINLCPGQAYEGVAFFSDTTLMYLNEASFKCFHLHLTHITILEPIAISLNTSGPACVFDSILVQISNPDDFTDFNWSEGSNSSEVTIMEAGTYTLEATDLNGCISSAQFELNISPPIELDSIDIQIQTDPVSPNGSIHLAASGGEGSLHYLWSNGMEGPQLSGITGGTYCLTITDGNGCEISDCIFVGADFPVLSFVEKTQALNCYGDSSGSLSILIEDGVAPVNLLLYGPEMDSTDLQGLEIGEEIVFDGLIAGLYNLELRDFLGQTRMSTIEIRQPDPITLESALIVEPSCFGYHNGSIELNLVGGTAPYQIEWEDDGGTVNTDGTKLSNIQSGFYIFQLLDASHCPYGPDTLLVSEPRPIGYQKDINAPFCEGVNDGWIEIVQIDGGTPPYNLRIAETETNLLPFFLPNLSAGKYLLEIEDAFGCQLTDSIGLDFQKEYYLLLGGISPIEVGDTIEIEVESNMDPVYLANWRPEETVNPPPLPNLNTQAFPIATTTFFLNLSNEQGCSIIDSITIEVLPSPLNAFYPNAFSPNKDGINDGFTIYGGRDLEEIKRLSIFNRWGSKIWESSHFQPNIPKLGWDGSFNGEPTEGGIYVFEAELLFLTGDIKTVRGEVLVIK